VLGDLWNTDHDERSDSSSGMKVGDVEAPLPYTEDLDTGGFWKAAEDGTLVVCACKQCGLVLHLQKKYCHRCGAWDTYWRELPPTGSLYSWTVTMMQLHPAFPAPYTVVLVELDDADGARLIGYLNGTPELAVGMRMKARFERIEEGVTLVQWEPADVGGIAIEEREELILQPHRGQLAGGNVVDE